MGATVQDSGRYIAPFKRVNTTKFLNLYGLATSLPIE